MSLAPSTPTEAMLNFLRQFLGADAPWQVVAIQGKDNIKAATFIAKPKREAAVSDWVRRWNSAGYDIYFTVNTLKQPLAKKPTKNDIAGATFLWIDLDPREVAAAATAKRSQGPLCIACDTEFGVEVVPLAYPIAIPFADPSAALVSPLRRDCCMKAESSGDLRGGRA